MLLRKLFIVSLLYFGIALAAAQQEPAYVILPQTEANTLIGARLFGLRGKITGTWEPKRDDVAELETNFNQVTALSRKNSPGPEVDNPASNFRQYLGLLAGRRKLIYVNAFCLDNNGMQPNYLRYLFQGIEGGGSCVWRALYDVSEGKFVGLSVNPVI